MAEATQSFAEVKEPPPSVAAQVTQDFAPPTETPPTGPLPQVPGFEIIKELGRGGMGVVYLARQVALNRVVALKMILGGGHAKPEDRVRFLAEAETIAKLKHPGIVSVYEFGTCGENPFFALEYIPGGSLDRALAGTPLPPKDAALLIEKLAQAMDHAHRQGVVHRDLKPGNILLAVSDQPSANSQNQSLAENVAEKLIAERCSLTAMPRISDFGLAKQMDAGTCLTATGAVMGTPSYMAPEQAEGKKGVGTATDIYALGAILYECLTGRPPFKAATPLETLVQVVSDEPVSVRNLQPQTPADLETICHKCLQKEPAKRYATAADLAADLRRFLDGQPIAARPVGRLERSWRWCRRNPAVAGLLAVVAIVLVAGTVVSLSFAADAYDQAESARRAQSRADQEAASARREQTRADQEANQAKTNEQRALAREKEARSNLYQAHMIAAQYFWDNKNYPKVFELLDRYRGSEFADLRKWEWYFQERLTNPPLRRFMDGNKPWTPKSNVLTVAYSPDGVFVTANCAEEIVIFRAATGEMVHRFPAQSLFLTDNAWQSELRFSPKGQWLVGATVDKVWVWEVGTWKLVQQISGFLPTYNIACLSFHPDSNRLAIGANAVPAYSRPSRLQIWDLSSRKLWHQFTDVGAATDQINDCEFDPQGQRLAAATSQGILLWDRVPSPKPRLLFTKEDRSSAGVTTPQGESIKVIWHSIDFLMFSPDGQWLASPCTGGKDDFRIWHVPSGKVAHSLKCSGTSVSQLVFSPDSTRLVSCGIDHTVRLWNIHTGQVVLSFAFPNFQSLAFSPDGARLAIANSQGVGLHLVAPDADRPVTWGDVPPPPAPNDFLLENSGENTLVRDRQTKKLLLTFPASVSRAFSANGKWFAQVNEAGEMMLRDVASGRLMHTWQVQEGSINQMLFTADGTRLATRNGKNSFEQVVCLWEIPSGRRLLRHNLNNYFDMYFSPDSRVLAVPYQEPQRNRRALKLWNTQTGEDLGEIDAINAFNNSGVLAFSPDAQRLALVESANNNNIVLWDVASRKPLRTLTGHKAKILSLLFHPEGSRLLSMSTDQSIFLWNVDSGELLRTIREASTDWIENGWADFSADGYRLSVLDKAPYDARPLTPQLQQEREARGLVEYFLGAPLAKPEVAAKLRMVTGITEEVRQEALQLLDKYEINPPSFVDAAWKIVKERNQSAAEYRRGKAWAAMAVQLAPKDQNALKTLGVALYRCEEYAAALEMLHRAEQVYYEGIRNYLCYSALHVFANPWTLLATNLWLYHLPEELLFLAMTYQRLGQPEPARQILARLHSGWLDPEYNPGDDAEAFLREAEELIEGKKPRP